MKKASLKEAQLRMLEILVEVDRICKKHNINYWLDAGTLLGAIRHEGFIPWDDDLDIGMLRKDYNKFLQVVKNELNSNFIFQSPETDNLCQNAFAKIRDKNSEIRSKHNNERNLGVFIDIFPYDSLTKKNLYYKKFFNAVILSKWFGDLEFKKPFLKNIFKNLIIFICKITNSIYYFIPYEKVIKRMYKNASKAEITEVEKIVYGVEVPFKEAVQKSDIFPLKTYNFEGLEFPVPNNHDNILKVFYNEWEKLPPKECQIPSHTDDIYIKN